jgi:hypothetical protein
MLGPTADCYGWIGLRPSKPAQASLSAISARNAGQMLGLRREENACSHAAPRLANIRSQTGVTVQGYVHYSGHAQAGYFGQTSHLRLSSFHFWAAAHQRVQGTFQLSPPRPCSHSQPKSSQFEHSDGGALGCTSAAFAFVSLITFSNQGFPSQSASCPVARKSTAGRAVCLPK